MTHWVYDDKRRRWFQTWEKQRKTFLDRIGLTKSFLTRKKKKNFSLPVFIRFMVKTWNIKWLEKYVQSN